LSVQAWALCAAASIDDVAAADGRLVSVVKGYCSTEWLSGSEGDDSADRVVRRYADGDTVSWNDFDSEAPHPAAQLRQHFMPGVALHAV